MSNKLHIEPTTKIIVLSTERAKKLPAKVQGKTVAFARKRGVTITTLRNLARSRVIRLVPRDAIKTAEVIALMERKGGCTRVEALAVTGWKAISFQQVADKTHTKIK